VKTGSNVIPKAATVKRASALRNTASASKLAFHVIKIANVLDAKTLKDQTNENAF
jgi:hypothetical protein